MKKLFTLFALLATALVTVQAQVTQVYGFESKQGTYTALTDGTALPFAAQGEDFDEKVFAADGSVIPDAGSYAGIPIGFDFKFNNQLMKQFLITSGGCILLGGDAVNVISTNSNGYFALATDGQGENVIGCGNQKGNIANEHTAITYKTEGEAGQRVLTVEWKELGLKATYYNNDSVCVSQQVKLYEADGKVEIIFNGWASAEKAENAYLNVRAGIRGTGDDYLFAADSWTEPVADANMGDITFTYDQAPADGLTFTFTPPTDCAAPSAQPTELVLSATSTGLSGEFSAAADADHYLVLLSEEKTLSELPADGKFYEKDEVLGNSQVLAYSTALDFELKKGLKSNTTYYIHVFSANSYCMYGPKYLTTAPLTLDVVTRPEAPASLTAAGTGLTSGKAAVAANAANEKVVVALINEHAYNEWDQGLPVGAFGTPDDEPTVNEAIEGGGQIVYVGPATESIVLDNLDQDGLYYLRAWSMDANGRLSSTYVDANFATGSNVPFTLDLSRHVEYNELIGWPQSGGFTKDLNQATEVASVTCAYQPSGEGAINWLMTPYVQLGEGAHRIKVSFNICTKGRWGMNGAPYDEWKEGDELHFQVSEDGENFTDIKVWNADDPATCESADDFPVYTLPFEAFAGKMVQIRMWWKTFADVKFVMRSFKVENVAASQYPENIAVVPGSIFADKASIDWTTVGDATAWKLRWRASGSEDWHEFDVTEKPYALSGLPGCTVIEVQMASVLGEAVSDWSEVLKFTSGYSVPFTEEFQFSELPSVWESAVGKLASPTVFNAEAEPVWGWFSNWLGAHLDFAPYGSTACNEWLLMPSLDLGDGTAKAYDLQVKMLVADMASAEDAKYMLVVSRDGTTFNADDVVATFTNEDLPEVFEEWTIGADLAGITGVVRPALYIEATGTPASLRMVSVSVSEKDVDTAISTLPADNTNLEGAAIYDLSGKLMPQGKLNKGVYILRQGGHSRKVLVK